VPQSGSCEAIRMSKPTVAVSMGDPAGIGPELVVKVLSQPAAYEQCRPFVIGDVPVLEAICRVVGAGARFRAIESLPEARFAPPAIDVLAPADVRIEGPSWGKMDPANGSAAAAYLREAAALALSGQVQGIVLAPMNKEAFHLAGYHYRDELAYLAELTGAAEPYILGRADEVWSVAVTEHVPFREIAGLVTQGRVLKHIRYLHEALVRVARSRPRIAVAALNVHGGEGGLFGREELDVIGPAIRAAVEGGMDARGPFPADTVFLTAQDQGFDGVVCMYHDQANIARKLLARRSGATFFMGLPVPCATTAHGTAFDRAGKGVADPASLATALLYTARLASL
jgi:4-hydroxythreonine-4-phosphate dehydrogenase